MTLSRRLLLLLAASAATLFAMPSLAHAEWMSYHGGPVVHGYNVVAVFWDPSGQIPADYSQGITSYVKNLAAASGTPNQFDLTAEYGDKVGPAYYQDNSGKQTPSAVYVRAPMPVGCSGGESSCVSTGQIEEMLLNDVVKPYGFPLVARGKPYVDAPIFAVYLPPDTDICSSVNCASSTWCADHAEAFPSHNQGFLYLMLPYESDGLGGCAGSQAPNGDLALDSVIHGTSHEIEETVTDPDYDGWYDDNDGDEIADGCENSLDNPLGGSDGSYWNAQIDSGQYWLQNVWDQRSGICNDSAPGGVQTGTANATVTSNLALGSVQVTKSESGTLTIEDTGAAPLTVGGLAASNPSVSFTSDRCSSHQISPGRTCTTDVTVKPTQPGALFSRITIPTSAEYLWANLTATAVPVPVTTLAELSATSPAIGIVAVGSTSPDTITVVNHGPAAVKIGSVVLAGASGYKIAPVPKKNTTVLCATVKTLAAKGGSCHVEVTYGADSVGVAKATVAVGTGVGVVRAPISATAVSPKPLLSLVTANQPAVAPVIVGTSTVLQTTVTNHNAAVTSPMTLIGAKVLPETGAPVFTAVITGGTCAANTKAATVDLKPGASCTYTMSLTPSFVGTKQLRVDVALNAGVVHAYFDVTASLPTIPLAPKCNENLAGIYGSTAPLTVPAGAVLCVSHASIGAPVNVQVGGSLEVTDSVFAAPVTAQGAEYVSVCGSSLLASLSAAGTTGGVIIGGAPGCTSDNVALNVTITGTAGAVFVGGADIAGKLSCATNTTVTDGTHPNNVRGGETGQCARL